MPALPFYSENLVRAYPFVEQNITNARSMTFSGGGEYNLPDNAIVDFVAMLSVGVNFNPQTDNVYLYEIARLNEYLVFVFRFTGEDSNIVELRFTRHVGGGSSCSLSSSSSVCAPATNEFADAYEFVQEYTEIAGTKAWLTTGTLNELANILNSSGKYLRRADQEIKILPARIQLMYSSFVSEINIANSPRTIAPDFCLPNMSSSAYIINDENITGEVRFKPGYNSIVTQNNVTNTLEFDAKKGEGEGEPCGEIMLNERETRPYGSKLFTGGPSCGELMKTVNGVHGPKITLIPGHGIDFVTDPDNYTIYVVPSMRNMAICLDDMYSSEWIDFTDSRGSSSSSVDWSCNNSMQAGYTVKQLLG